MKRKPKTERVSDDARITIDGTGSVPIHVNGAMTRLKRGEPVDATAAQVDFLTRTGVKFTKGK